MNGTPMPIGADIRPFRLAVDDSAIADLKRRLAQARWPDEAPEPPWRYGTSVGFMRELVDYWAREYDWRRTEAALNAHAQFVTAIDGIDVHFLKVEGRGPDPKPLLLSHGWPGSVLEFLKLIPLLTDPAAHGGNAADAFTVVVPSLPGYTLSFRPNQERRALPEIGATFHELMARLGYSRYGAQGGDWGSFVTAWLGANRAEHVLGIHLNLLPLRRDAAMFSNPTEEERRFLVELEAWLKEETGYQWIQGTRPQTLAFGLADSPVGLAAWIAEKYRAWTDCDGDPRNALSMDEMLGNISLYWFTNCIGASFWPYYARMHGPWPIDGRIGVPTGYCEFPREILRPPRAAAERVFTDIRRWSVMTKGGHFAALEQPEALAREIREFFRSLA
ncbi:MAG TPA: epoxide hydrolase [Burkholderiales bacterium]|nr:epoxide hydrolase [Burkholderiales bacterium]